MRKTALLTAVLGIFAVSGCTSQPPVIEQKTIYEGDSPEAARYKAHASCLAAAFEAAAQQKLSVDRTIERGRMEMECDEKFGD